jgi:hypothetical protein
MNRDAMDCLKRATECARLAEAENDPKMRLFLKNLAVSWMKEANKSVNDQWIASGFQ